MKPLIVVENPNRWHLHVPGVTVISAREYVSDMRYGERRGTTVYNLCRQYTYQRLGYYVSLLAAARGHRPLPSVETLQAVRTAAVVRVVGEDLDEVIQGSLARLKSDRFILSLYFGRNPTERYDRLGRALFNAFPAPFLRAVFVLNDEGWRLQSLRPVSAAEIPDTHRAFAVEQAASYFATPRPARPRKPSKYELAILWRDVDDAPSNTRAIRKFIRAARKLDMAATVIGPDDYPRIAEFDALFIRETTYVNNHTYRFAARAHTEGMVVIDDPQSIVRATNKVYQAEVFRRRGIPSPKTIVVEQGRVPDLAEELGFPLVIKRPDSAFSAGVVCVNDTAELERTLGEFFDTSDLVIAQQFTPTDYDWRIGIIDGRPLYAARYHMARGHWQIIQRHAGRERYGRVETVPLDTVPSGAILTALSAAAPFGDGLYGVDLKPVGRRFLVMEVNDNPNIDAGYEDRILKDQLYDTIMTVFRRRLDQRGDTPT